MLPNANGAAVTILAVMIGRPGAGDDQLHLGTDEYPRRAARPPNIRHIVTSRAFVEKAHLEKIVERARPRRRRHLP